MRELRLQTMLHTQAVGYATGSVKKENFFKFLDELETKKAGKKVDVNKTLQKIKEFGISIEEK